MSRGPTVEQYADAIRDARGIISVAARHLGVSRRAVYNAIERSEKVKQAFEDAREAIVDMAEGQLFKQASDGNYKAVTFILRTLGKRRGYVERTESVVSLTDDDLDNMTDEELERLAATGRLSDPR